MELNEIKSMWLSYENKLQTALKLNRHCLEFILAQRLRSQLTPLLWHRIIEVALHISAAALLFIFIIKNLSGPLYVMSAGMLLIFYTVAIVMCFKQIKAIRKIDYSKDIVTIQSLLVTLQTHLLNHARVAALCIPVFLAYPMVVSKAIRDFHLTGLQFMDIQNGYTGDWWSVQFKITIVLIPLCIWFYRETSYKNINKHWVKLFIQKTSGTRVRKAIEFVNEIEELKREA
jgi:hypothetical protein